MKKEVTKQQKAAAPKPAPASVSATKTTSKKPSFTKPETKKVVVPAVPPKEEKKDKPAPVTPVAPPTTVAFTDLAQFLKDNPPKDKWYTFIDGTKGNVSTFFKYCGQVIYACSEDDMKDENLNKLMKRVLFHSMNLHIDFMNVAVPLEKLVHPGAFPEEIFSPEKIRSDELIKKYQNPGEEIPFRRQGGFVFMSTDDKNLPKWAKEKTKVVYITP